MTDSVLDNIEKRYNAVVVFFYCLLILFLPISIALVENAAGMAIFVFLLKHLALNRARAKAGLPLKWRALFFPESRWDQDYFQRALNVFVGCVFVSVLLSRFPVESGVAFVAKLLEGYYLYVTFVECVRTRDHFKYCVAVSIAAVFLMAADGLSQFIWGADFLRQLPLQAKRVSATLRHANDFGAYLTAYIPMIFGLLVLPLRKGASLSMEWGRNSIGTDLFSKVVLGVLFVMMLICLGLTFSRGSWVGFWCSLIIFVFATRKFLVPAIVVSLIFLAVFLPFLMKYRDVSFTTDSVNLTRDYGKIEPTSENLNKMNQTQRERVLLAHRFQLGMGRFGFWEEAGNLIKKYPFFGTGLNTYSKLTTGYAHNCYLQMAAEIGLIGLLTFLAMIAVLFWQSWQALRNLQNVYLEALMAGLLGGLGGFLIQSGFDTTLYSVQLGNLMWVLIGFIVAIPRIARSAE